MATGGSSCRDVDIDDTVKNQCPICLENFHRPKLLPCFHSFCQSCLQGMADTSPSFPCPSCRKLVLLPPGGVQALQTNFYIEDDRSSPPRRLCDMCADDREATHSCLQCRQRFCLPCCNFHDSIQGCHGHSVVSLTVEEDKGCGKGVPQKVEMCPKHPEQRLLLYCNTCQADLCLQCKLTQHEGHPTQDLADIRSKVKDKLKDKLGTLTLEMQQMDHIVSAFEDRCSKLQQQKKGAEQACHARAAMLHQWVNQSLDNAVQSIQISAEQLSKPWQDHAQQLHNRKLALQAQQDHILQVLREGEEADVVLEARLSSSPVEDVDVTELTKELTKDIPAFRLEHSTTAVNQPQLRAFIGVLEPAQQTSGHEETPVPSVPTSVQGKVSGCLSLTSVKGSDVTHRTGTVHSASRGQGVLRKKPSRELVYSKNPRSSVHAICPISHSPLWVRYNPAGDDTSPRYLKLFDAAGQVLTTVEDSANYFGSTGLLYITDDVLLSWRDGESSVQLISPDGSRSTYDMGRKVEWFVSRATNDIHYLRECDKNCLLSVEFASASDDQTDSADSDSADSADSDSADSADDSDSAVSHPQSPVTPSLTNRLTHSILDVVFSDTPSDKDSVHVSAGERYFAFIPSGKGKVEVYSTTAGSQSSTIVCSYTPQKWPTDAGFCLIDGKEMLLVTVYETNKVHVIDHTDGGLFVRYLNTGPLNLERPYRLATDYDQHVWVGCDGGKVVMIDL